MGGNTLSQIRDIYELFSKIHDEDHARGVTLNQPRFVGDVFIFAAAGDESPIVVQLTGVQGPNGLVWSRK